MRCSQSVIKPAGAGAGGGAGAGVGVTVVVAAGRGVTGASGGGAKDGVGSGSEPCDSPDPEAAGGAGALLLARSVGLFPIQPMKRPMMRTPNMTPTAIRTDRTRIALPFYGEGRLAGPRTRRSLYNLRRKSTPA